MLTLLTRISSFILVSYSLLANYFRDQLLMTETCHPRFLSLSHYHVH